MSEFGSIGICGTGYLGSELLRIEEGEGPKILGIPREFQYIHKNAQELSENLLSVLGRVGAVVNCSGPSSVESSMQNREFYLTEPVNQIKSHFELFSLINIAPTYVYMSTASVYGDTSKRRANELELLNPISPYAQGKKLAEDELNKLSLNYSGKIIVLRLTSVFSNRLRARVLNVIRNQIKVTHHVSLDGISSDSRDYLHLDQLSKVIKLLIAKEEAIPSFEIFNLGSEQNFTVEEIIRIAFAAVNLPAKYEFANNRRTYDPAGIFVDTEKLRTFIDFPIIDIESALKQYFSSQGVLHSTLPEKETISDSSRAQNTLADREKES